MSMMKCCCFFNIYIQVRQGRLSKKSSKGYFIDVAREATPTITAQKEPHKVLKCVVVTNDREG